MARRFSFDVLRHRATPVAIGVLLCAAGCTTLNDARAGPGARLDPWENWNRKVFSFNEGLDRYLLKPVSTAYAKAVPQLVRRGVDNFFANFADGWSAVNDVLQGKPQPAFDNVVRFTTNSTIGILGILDIASEMGVERHHEDFGLTLGRWGFGPGAYIVLPLLGPSTVRDTIALPLDRHASPAVVLDGGVYQYSIVGLQIINTRANLLGASQVLDDIALDKYTFLRDAYLQRRRSLVFAGADSAGISGGGDYAPMTIFAPTGEPSSSATPSSASAASAPPVSASAPSAP